MAVLLSMFMLWGCEKKEYCTVTLHYRRAHIALSGGSAGKEECSNNTCEYTFEIGREKTVGELYDSVILTSENGYESAGWFSGKDHKEFVSDDLRRITVDTDLDLYAYFYDVQAENWMYGTDGWWYLKDGVYPKDEWIIIDGKTYHFDGHGNMTTGWYYESGNWYFLNRSGEMCSGWKKIKDHWYYFDLNGIMLTGWQEIDGKQYCFYDNGMMAGGWARKDNEWFYFEKDGTLKTGWLDDRGDRFYLGEDGVMKHDEWVESGGKRYYLSSDGTMARNRWVDDYYVNDKGVMEADRWIGKYHVGSDGRWDDVK